MQLNNINVSITQEIPLNISCLEYDRYEISLFKLLQIYPMHREYFLYILNNMNVYIHISVDDFSELIKISFKDNEVQNKQNEKDNKKLIKKIARIGYGN